MATDTNSPMWAVKATSLSGILEIIVTKHDTHAQALVSMHDQIATNGSKQISTRGANWNFFVVELEAENEN